MLSNQHPESEPDLEFRERVRAARRMTPEERILAGLKMFEDGCEGIRNQIRASFPDADGAVVDHLVRHVIRFAECRGVL